MNPLTTDEQLAKISSKLDRLTNPAKLAGLQFIAGIFHSLGSLFGTAIIAGVVVYLFSQMNLSASINKYIQSLIPKPQINIQSPF